MLKMIKKISVKCYNDIDMRSDLEIRKLKVDPSTGSGQGVRRELLEEVVCFSAVDVCSLISSLLSNLASLVLRCSKGAMQNGEGDSFILSLPKETPEYIIASFFRLLPFDSFHSLRVTFAFGESGGERGIRTPGTGY
jgi:hypothetical protein